MTEAAIKAVDAGLSLKRIWFQPLLVSAGHKVTSYHTIEELSMVHDLELADGFELVEVWIESTSGHRRIVGSPMRPLREYNIVLPFASRIHLTLRNTAEVERQWVGTLVVEPAA